MRGGSCCSDDEKRIIAYVVACDVARELVSIPQCDVLQYAGCGMFPGLEYALIVTAQAYESHRRGLSLARKREMDLLLRLTRTSQIERAIDISTSTEGDCCVVAGYGGEGCLRVVEDAASISMENVRWASVEGVAGTDCVVGFKDERMAALMVLVEEAALLNARAHPSPG